MSTRGFDPGAGGRIGGGLTEPDGAAERPCAQWIVWERWVAAMDERTCPRCAGMHGRTYPYGEGPQPPLHNGCRCSRVIFDWECVERPAGEARGVGGGRRLS